MTREKLTARRRSKTIFVAALLLLTFSSWIWRTLQFLIPDGLLLALLLGCKEGAFPD